jgi:acetyl-CoA acetyltransferase
MRFGHGEVVDGMLKDGLWDVYNDYAMGLCAELCADNHSVSREAQVCFWLRMGLSYEIASATAFECRIGS